MRSNSQLGDCNSQADNRETNQYLHAITTPVYCLFLSPSHLWTCLSLCINKQKYLQCSWFSRTCSKKVYITEIHVMLISKFQMLRVTLANDFLFCQISSGMIFIIYSRVITRLEHLVPVSRVQYLIFTLMFQTRISKVE